LSAAGGDIGGDGRNAASSLDLAGCADLSGGATGCAGATGTASGRAALDAGNFSP
jgi:hypothetical protein